MAPTIGLHEVYLWSTDLVSEKKPLPRLANKFACHDGHCFPRHVLGWHMQCTPCQVQFDRAEFGKPAIHSDIASKRRLSFNLSHSGRYKVCAVCSQPTIGVDIESFDQSVNWRGISERFFSPEESDFLTRVSSFPETDFMRIWVRKEAVVKALGVGLHMPLSEFCVVDIEQACFLPKVEVPLYRALFYLSDFSLDCATLGAVATPLPVERVAHRSI